MKVFFIVVNEMMTGVIPSQIIAPARAYSSILTDLSISIVFLEPARVALGRKARARIRELRALWPEGKMHLLPYAGRLGEFAPAISLGGFLRARRRRFTLHCRGPEATIQAARAASRPGRRIVFDSRGASDHEAALRLKVKGLDTGRESIEQTSNKGLDLDRMAVECADAITAISDPLAQKLRAMPASDGKPVVTIPCCVERPLFSSAARSAIRGKLGLDENELLFVHTSTETYWEDFDRVISFFRKVNARRRAKLLFLSTLQKERITGKLQANDPLLERMIFYRAAPGEVGDYLSAADAGLLLRKPHETHLFASPIKFAEYLGAGLTVVVSNGIGAMGEVAESRNVGVVFTEDEDLSATRLLDLLDGERDALRQRCLLACERLFLWKNYAQDIRKLYGLL
jgi:glycosyltransferase involved in cell wall biosynthesis